MKRFLQFAVIAVLVLIASPAFALNNIFQNGSNVGIGTTTPQDALSVATTTLGSGLTITNSGSACVKTTQDGSSQFAFCEINQDLSLLSNIANQNDGAFILKGAQFGGAYMDFVNQNSAGGFTFAFGSNQTDNSRGVNIIPNTANKGQLLINTTVANDSASISLGGNYAVNAMDFWDGGVGFPMRISASSTVMEFDLGNTLSNSAQFRSSVGSTNPVFDVIAGGGVGIGTSSPSANGGLAISAGTGSGVFSRSLVIADNTGAEKFLFHSDGTEWINTALGIGTTSPTGALAVVGGFFTTASSTGMNGINLTDGCFAVKGTCITGGGGSSQWTTSGSNIYFNTGNVGIGSTTPFTKLAVAGTITADNINATSTTANSAFKGTMTVGNPAGGVVTSFNTDSIYMSGNGFFTGAICGSSCSGNQINMGLGNALDFLVNNVSRIYIANGGNVGIGSTTPQVPLVLSSGATTTMQVVSSVTTKGGCIVMQDSAGGTYTQITSQAGVLKTKVTSSLTSCQ